MKIIIFLISSLFAIQHASASLVSCSSTVRFALKGQLEAGETISSVKETSRNVWDVVTSSPSGEAKKWIVTTYDVGINACMVADVTPVDEDEPAADSDEGTILYDCQANLPKGSKPITGYSIVVSKDEATQGLQFTFTPICPACMVTSNVVDITKAKLTGTNQVYTAKGINLTIYLESFVPTKTYPALFKFEGKELDATCNKF